MCLMSASSQPPTFPCLCDSRGNKKMASQNHSLFLSASSSQNPDGIQSDFSPSSSSDLILSSSGHFFFPNSRFKTKLVIDSEKPTS